MAIRKRTVYDTYAPNGTPVAGARIVVRQVGSSYSADAQFPAAYAPFAITGEDGLFSFDLWCNEDGEAESEYEFKLPNGALWAVVLPYDDGSDVKLSTLQGTSPAPGNPQYPALKTQLDTHIANVANPHAVTAAQAGAALAAHVQAVDKGGTSLTSYAVGDLLYASGATTLAKLAGVAAGSVLLAGGVGTAPAWGQVADAHVAPGAAIGWSKISKTDSSLADLTTRSAADLTTGNLAYARMATGAGTWSVGAGKIRMVGSSAPDAIIHIGENALIQTPDIVIGVGRQLATGTTHAHCFGDETTFARNTYAYNSYDARVTMSGTSFNHYVSFQSRPRLNMTGTLGFHRALSSQPDIDTGTVTTLSHIHIQGASVSNGGWVGTQIGLYINNLENADVHYAIYSERDSPVYLAAAPVTAGTYNGQTISAASSLTGTLAVASTLTVSGSSFAVGGATVAGVAAYIRSTGLAGTTQTGVYSNVTFAASATSAMYGARISVASGANGGVGYTTGEVTALLVDGFTKHADHTATILYGVRIANQTAGDTNYALYTNLGTVRFGDAVTCASTLTVGSTLGVTGAVTGASFSGVGTALTALNASNVASGTLADARLSANVPLLNAANTFTQALVVNAAITGGAYNGQTINATASLTGTLAVGPSTISSGAHAEVNSATGTATLVPTILRITSNSNANDWTVNADWARLEYFSKDAGLGSTARAWIGAQFSNIQGTITDLVFATANAGTATEKLKITAAGSIVIGTAALATTATAGYLYLASCAGVATGVPTAYTGRNAIQYDSTNKKLGVYDGGWIWTAALTA